MLACCCAQTGMLKGERWVPPDLEVAHLPHMMGHPYGGIFLFSQSARMMRPVRYYAGGGGLELIGTLEQVGRGIVLCLQIPKLGLFYAVTGGRHTHGSSMPQIRRAVWPADRTTCFTWLLRCTCVGRVC